MQPDAQVRQGMGAPHGVSGRGTGHHEACGVQHAGTVRALDGLVDRGAEAEIVGSEDDALHAPVMTWSGEAAKLSAFRRPSLAVRSLDGAQIRRPG